MEQTTLNLDALDWATISDQLHKNGYALLGPVLDKAQCEGLKAAYTNTSQYRKTVVMARHRFGLGEYKYFDYPLPLLIQELRSRIYPQLVPIANTWSRALNLGLQFPFSHQEFLLQCQQHNQHKATALILKYGAGGYNTLHQDLYGQVYFPLQLLIFLSEPDVAYTGGEFVLTQQNPRAQTKAKVFSPKQGQALIFASNFRPVKGEKGYHRVHLKHGVSEVLSGERYTLGIIFHDALS